MINWIRNLFTKTIEPDSIIIPFQEGNLYIEGNTTHCELSDDDWQEFKESIGQ